MLPAAEEDAAAGGEDAPDDGDGYEACLPIVDHPVVDPLATVEPPTVQQARCPPHAHTHTHTYTHTCVHTEMRGGVCI